MTRGIDKGTTFTKDDQGNIIKSTIRENGEDILLDKKLIVDIFDKSYIVGEKGRYGTDLMKAQHENTKVLVYTILALGSSQTTIIENVVLGLPIGMYIKNKDEMKSVFEDKVVHMRLNKQKKIIQIKNCEVFPESAGAFYTQNEENGLVIDIGGLSIDNALFEKGKLVKFSTYSMGTMKLYNTIANDINSDYGLSLTEWDIPDKLENGLEIDGEKVDLYLDLNLGKTIDNHATDIIERLKLDYDIRKENVILTGGGSLLLHNYFKKNIPQVRLLDPQFANAKGFKNVGEVLFK